MSEIPSGEKQEITDRHDAGMQKEEKAEIQLKRVVAEVMQSEFSGPIPPPSIIKGYEEVLPGSADRIIGMAERQSAHRQAMEKRMVLIEARDSLLGILFAFLLGIGCIGAAVTMVIMVPQNVGAISGAVIGATGIGSIIVTFIKSTRVSHDNESKKEKENSKNKD